MSTFEDWCDPRRTIDAAIVNGVVHKVQKKGRGYECLCGMHVPFKEKQLLLVKQRPEDITCPNCKTRMPVVCAWCGNPMGEKDGQGQTGTSHGICPDCLNKHFPHHADKINQILGTKLKKEVTSGKSK